MMRNRRGSALILVLMMTLAIAGLSIAAIFMSSSAGLLSAFYDRERTHRLAAESALEMARARLLYDSTLVVPDTGMMQLYAGLQINDADGLAVPNVRVNVYASVTGDTTGGQLPTVTLLAAAYDNGGTRQVRRLDLRRESFARYAMFVDSFPAGTTHGPGTVMGRAHSNGTWRGSAAGNRYRDTVSVVTAVSGSGTFDVDSLVGVERITFPGDSTFPRLDTLASGANLRFTPLTGRRGTRLDFVAFDADNDGTIEDGEGFARVWDLADTAGLDTTRLKLKPITYSNLFGQEHHRWDDPIIQSQCGASYLRNGRWHFFPVAVHRTNWARSIIQSTAMGDYPQVSTIAMDIMDDYDRDAVSVVMLQRTARCYPPGSPFLVNTERMTNHLGVVTGTAADTVPFGRIEPAGGWPVDAPFGYGGNDTTFTPRSFSCIIDNSGFRTGRCVMGTRYALGSWRTFAGTAVTGVSTSQRQAAELPYLWPFDWTRNPNSRRVISAAGGGTLYLGGTIRGRVTVRAEGNVHLIDRIRYANDPNDPEVAQCSDALGVVAVGDILVVEGLHTRVRRVGSSSFLLFTGVTTYLGGEPRFTVHGNLMSLTGTVGTEAPNETQGLNVEQYRCPDDGGTSTRSNGGCLAVTGGVAMRRYSDLYGGSNTGMRYYGASDRCQATTRRPPFFPLTNRYTFVRALEIDASQANTPAKIRTLLLRLKGKQL
ncbi:MAG: pilus assembly PilX N-terminal domain-containing protein [Gemmatimonadaceae bacterium]|nr:pilus assembly PilX N-terminal domain-containing protein [Gemmatimonadaceae bacterium]